MWGFTAAIIIVLLFLFYMWYTSDSRKSQRIKSAFTNGVKDTAEITERLADLRQLTRPRFADYVRVGAVIRDQGHINHNAANNGLVIQLFQAGLGAEVDDEIETAYMLHQIIDAGGIMTQQHAMQMEEIRDRSIAARVAKAKQETDSRAEAATRFLEDSQHFTSAAQNVHDSSVNSDLRETLAILQQDVPDMGARAAISEAHEMIKLEKDAVRRAKAMATLAKIAKGETCSTFDMRRESDIFSVVWSRCDHEANKDNRKLMREAIIDALVDSVEAQPTDGRNYEPVCINGRIARVINSLTLLDFDPRVGGAMTYEAYRNQILEETKGIFNVTLEEFENGTQEQKDAAVAFEEGKDEEAALLLEELDKKIEANLARYNDKIPALEVESLRKECKVWVGCV